MNREDVKTKIHYVLKAGHTDGSLGRRWLVFVIARRYH